ncbi:MAG TPA: hypothetical protein VNP37_10955 [Actinomycetospora sp.]|nr:hypothetical protein [Actinomycetospora sp.]
MRVCLYPEAGMAAVAAFGTELDRDRLLPSAVRVVDLDVGVVVAALVPLPAGPLGCAGRCCRRNAYRLLDDLIARA